MNRWRGLAHCQLVFACSLALSCWVSVVEASTPSSPASDDKGSLGVLLSVFASGGEPISGATLRIPALELELVSNEAGELQLSLPSGSYDVELSASGFAMLRETLVIDEAAALAGVFLYLDYDLGELVITGASTQKLLHETPVKTQVVDRRSIERKGAANLAQAVKHSTGVRLENNCQNCNFTQLRLNGLDGRYAQVLINSRPVFSSLAGVYGLEQIPAEMIDRVEIVKGGGSALYGGNAIAGVLNVITKRPSKSYAGVKMGANSLNDEWGGHHLGARAGYVTEDRRVAVALSGALNSREDWDSNDDGFSDIGWYRQQALSADLFWDPIQHGTFTLRAQAIGERRRGGDSLDLQEFDAAISEGGTTLRQGFEARWEHSFPSGVAYSLGYTFAHTSRDSYYGGGGNVEPPDGGSVAEWQAFWDAKSAALSAYGHTRNPFHFADAMVHMPFELMGEGLLTAGVQFQHEGLTDEFPAYSRKLDENYHEIAGLLEADWHPTDWNETIIGVRVAKNSTIDSVVAIPRLAMVFEPLDWMRLRSSFSMGYRAPQVFDEDLHITIVGGEGAIVKNADGLDPELSVGGAQQVELEWAINKAWSLLASVNGYVTHLRDSFVLEDQDDPNTPSEREFLRRNLGSTLVYGAELELALKHGELFTGRVGITLERGEHSEPDPDFGTTDVF
ncbi:MAG: TonB-dependent receptor, partial [Myxococcota bacterium]|nr:TonB-dependent receptor [Myxococcota bacterium]